MDVEGRADADHHRGLDLAQVGGHPALLLGRAQAHPDDVGPGLIDHLHDPRVFFLGERPEGRAIGADDLQAGELPPEPRGQPFCHTLAAAVEEIPEPSLG